MVLTDNLIDSTKTTVLAYIDDFIYMAIGTGTTAESPTLTALTTEVARSEGTVTVNSGNVTTENTTLFPLSSGANGETITEVGVFNMSLSGDMCYRKLLPVSVAKTDEFELEITTKTTTVVANG